MFKRRRSYFNRLSVKISTLAIAIIIVLTLLSGGILHNSIQETSEHAIAMSSVETAQNIANHVDGNMYNDFLQNQTESDVYWDLRHQLNDFRIKSGVLYVYTLGVTDDNDVVILVDGMPKDEIELAAEIGEPIDVTTFEHVEPVLKGQGSFSEIVEDPSYGDYLSSFAPITDDSGNVIGILGVDTGADQVGLITSEVTKSILPVFIIAMLVLMVVAIIFLVRYIMNSLQPLHTIQVAANNIARGDISQASNIIRGLPKNRTDEIGQLGASIDNMVEQLKAVIQNLTETSQNVNAASEELSANADQALQINRHIEQSIQDVAIGSNKQLESTEESSRSIESITNNIQEISDNTIDASDMSLHVLSETQKGKQTVEEILQQMNTISSSTGDIASIIEQLDKNSNEIVQIVDMITDIAEQTNLLALNAAIEAARAGEHGQGFAVVSEEIRKLADESKKSADQITALINSISGDTKRAVITMNEGRKETESGAQMAVTVDKAFQSILENVTKMTNQVQDVSASSQEILANSEEVTASIAELENIAKQAATNTDEVATNTEIQVKTMQDVSQSSEDLNKITLELQSVIRRFNI